MRRRLVVLLLVAAAWTCARPATAAPQVLPFDPGNAAIHFQPRIAGLLHPTGVFERFQGRLSLDAEDLTRSEVRVSLSAAAIRVPLPGAADRLRSPDYFDAARFPDIDFRSTGVRAAADGRLAMSGLLTVRGVTRPETLEVAVQYGALAGAGPTGFRADGIIRRSDFGMTADPLLVGDEIRLSIQVALGPDGGAGR